MFPNQYKINTKHTFIDEKKLRLRDNAKYEIKTREKRIVLLKKELERLEKYENLDNNWKKEYNDIKEQIRICEKGIKLYQKSL